MDSLFPFGFPVHLAFYLVVYVLTLIVHVILMAYVLAGSFWLAWATLLPGPGAIPRAQQPLARLLRDWMPFALSGVITAGVAPLLFVQILYQQSFYTANLLLGWRWLIVVPVLVLVFYLLYVLKSSAISRWPAALRLGMPVAVAACFLFVAFCWTANHLLSLNAAAWPAAYESGTAVTSAGSLALRLATWVSGSFVVLTLLSSWQLRGMSTRTHVWTDAPADVNWPALFQLEQRRLALGSLSGLVTSLAFAPAYFFTLPESVRSHVTGAAGFGWLVMLLLAAVILVALQVRQIRTPHLGLGWLIANTLAIIGLLLAVASLREVIRLAQADLNKTMQATSAALAVGGFPLFLGFTVLNAVLIAFCVRLVRQGGRQKSEKV